MKKKSLLFCLLTLFVFNFTGAFASNGVAHKKFSFAEYKRMKTFFNDKVALRKALNNGLIICMEPDNFTADAYDNALHTCIGIWVNFPQFREFIEKKLRSDHEAVVRGKQLVNSEQ